MKKFIAVIGAFLAMSSFFVMTSSDISGAGMLGDVDFPGVGELFDPDNIHYPDIGLSEIFGFAQDLVSDPNAFSSVASLSGFTGFLADTFVGLVQNDSPEGISIGGIAMIVCIVVIILCIISAILGTRTGREYVRERKGEE